MNQDYLCINIPEELQQYNKIVSIIDKDTITSEEQAPDFGVKLIKDKNGNLIHTAYYSDNGELLKKIFYNGSTVASIEHYRNNSLYSVEKYNDGKMVRKTKYNRDKNTECIINYEYNRKDQITSIRKLAGKYKYEVDYGYDELLRVNSRIIKINSIIAAEQRYKYDILDRIVEYKDENQTIKVQKLNQKNELISYIITDKIGNTITVINKYICSEYIGTEIELNGHKTTICDRNYIDNVILKKPFTSEDDLDFVISKMLFKPSSTHKEDIIPITKRKPDEDIINMVIHDNITDKSKPLPISLRKMRLLQTA